MEFLCQIDTKNQHISPNKWTFVQNPIATTRQNPTPISTSAPTVFTPTTSAQNPTTQHDNFSCNPTTNAIFDPSRFLNPTTSVSCAQSQNAQNPSTTNNSFLQPPSPFWDSVKQTITSGTFPQNTTISSTCPPNTTPRDKSTHQCYICLKTFPTERALNQHIYIHKLNSMKK